MFRRAPGGFEGKWKPAFAAGYFCLLATGNISRTDNASIGTSGTAKGYADITKMIDSGKAKVGIIFPPDFAEKLRRGETAQVQVLVDAGDSMVSNSAIATANSMFFITASLGLGILISNLAKTQMQAFQRSGRDVLSPDRGWANAGGQKAADWPRAGNFGRQLMLGLAF